jgi:hypothetical protein
MARGFGKFLLANNTTQSVWKPQDIPKQINDDTPTHPQHQSNLLGFNSLLQIDSRHLQQQTMVFFCHEIYVGVLRPGRPGLVSPRHCPQHKALRMPRGFDVPKGPALMGDPKHQNEG